MKEEKIYVPARIESLEMIFAFVNKILDECGCPPKVQKKIRITIEEVFVNIASYAYPDAEGWAEIYGSVEDNCVTFKVVDGGIPFNPLQSDEPDFTLPGEEREIGGLGIFMAKKRMDDIQYEYKNDLNILTMKKSF